MNFVPDVPCFCRHVCVRERVKEKERKREREREGERGRERVPEIPAPRDTPLATLSRP